MDYRDRLKKLRLENHLKQEEVAVICNVSNKAVSHWETHRREVPIDCVIALCKYYQVSSDYVLGIRGNDA